jgi:hypothetical protein
MIAHSNQSPVSPVCRGDCATSGAAGRSSNKEKTAAHLRAADTGRSDRRRDDVVNDAEQGPFSGGGERGPKQAEFAPRDARAGLRRQAERKLYAYVDQLGLRDCRSRYFTEVPLGNDRGLLTAIIVTGRRMRYITRGHLRPSF